MKNTKILIGIGIFVLVFVIVAVVTSRGQLQQGNLIKIPREPITKLNLPDLIIEDVRIRPLVIVENGFPLNYWVVEVKNIGGVCAQVNTVTLEAMHRSGVVRSAVTESPNPLNICPDRFDNTTSYTFRFNFLSNDADSAFTENIIKVIAEVDKNNSVVESNENNNVRTEDGEVMWKELRAYPYRKLP